MEVTRQQKAEAVARAFMADDPEEYAGETVEQVAESLIKGTSPDFLDSAYKFYKAHCTLATEGAK